MSGPRVVPTRSVRCSDRDSLDQMLIAGGPQPGAEARSLPAGGLLASRQIRRDEREAGIEPAVTRAGDR